LTKNIIIVCSGTSYAQSQLLYNNLIKEIVGITAENIIINNFKTWANWSRTHRKKPGMFRSPETAYLPLNLLSDGLVVHPEDTFQNQKLQEPLKICRPQSKGWRGDYTSIPILKLM
jgi:hypothetical protein